MLARVEEVGEDEEPGEGGNWSKRPLPERFGSMERCKCSRTAWKREPGIENDSLVANLNEILSSQSF